MRNKGIGEGWVKKKKGTHEEEIICVNEKKKTEKRRELKRVERRGNRGDEE